jgi:uncharacterized protein
MSLLDGTPLAHPDNRHLILFARYPTPGAAKTRLIAQLGAVGAAQLAKRLTEHTLKQAERLGCPLTLYGTGAAAADFAAWLDADFMPQSGAELGARMANAIAHTYTRGAARIILVGSDCPGLNTAIMHEAFAALEHYDVVFGPAADGGYYLVGMRQLHPALFADMRWSHDHVLRDSLARLDTLSHYLLPILHDIDVPADLAHVPPELLA